MVISILVGSLLGILSGLGVGGGSLLILWLTFVVDMEPPQARQLNLLFFLPCATASLLFRKKEGSVHFKQLLPGILAGCAAAFLISLLSRQLDTSLLKRLFGILLIFTGIREIRYKEKREGQ